MKTLIDNFDTVRSLLEFTSDDDYYFIEIIRRKKDFDENSDVKYRETLSTYYISSFDKFDAVKEEIKTLCRLQNARAYINLNRKSKKKTTMILMRECLSMIENDDYHKVFSRAASAAGQCTGDKESRTFLIDIDTPDLETANSIVLAVVELGGIIKAKLKTVNGVHLITTPFNTMEFGNKMKENKIDDVVDIKHNSLTVLFYEKL